MSRIVKDLVKGLPEIIQPIIESKHLNFIFGIESLSKPTGGSKWYKVITFPSNTAGQIKKTPSAVSSQGQPQFMLN